MLKTLRRGFGFRIAFLLAVFAALCLVAPPAVLAFGHGTNTPHCLSHADILNHGMGGSAAHADHSPKHGDQAQHSSGKAPGCCGLFCLSALVPDCVPALAGPLPHEALRPQRDLNFSARVSDLLDPPPIAVPSV
jgi:hypothetical protein